jgi:hypothetical protein
VIDRVDALERLAKIFPVANIAVLKFDFWFEVVGPARRGAVDLWRKIIQNSYRISMGQQFVR